MEIKKAKKIGLITATSMLVASVIGIGIFLKNLGIFNANDNNSIGILISWIIGIVIALTAAYSFAEVSTSNKSNSGLGGWAEKFWGKKFGYFVKFSLPSFYLSLLGAILVFFLGEAFFVVIGQENVHFGYIALFAFVIGILIYFLNYFSIKVSGWISIFANVVKFLPIAAIIITSIVVSIIRGSVGLFEPGELVPPPGEDPLITGPIDITGILAAVPSVLFAFDSFLVVGNIAEDIRKPRKNVPIAIISGMIFCGVVYILITIGQILVANGNALNFFDKLFPESQSLTNVLSIIMNIVIFIAIYGVINSVAAGTIRSHAVLINQRIAAYSFPLEKVSNKIFKSNKSENSAGLLCSIIFFIFYWIILLIPSVSVGSNGNDHYIDWISNFPTLFFFLIYGIVILGGIINRFTDKIEVIKFKGFLPIGVISFALITFIFGYQFFYANIAIPIIDPTDLKATLGLFHKHGYTNDFVGFISNLEGALIFVGFLLWFIALPFINLGFKKIMKIELNI